MLILLVDENCSGVLIFCLFVQKREAKLDSITDIFRTMMAYTLIGGTVVGTVLTLVFLPALYSIWFRVRPTAVSNEEAQAVLAHS